MKKIYSLLFFLTAFATLAQADSFNYNGTLDIDMAGMELAKGQEATVTIDETGDGFCSFLLPDFSLTMGGTTLELGDIFVENVSRSDDNGDGKIDIAGSVEHLVLPNDDSLPEDQKIHAKVDIEGTEDAFSGEIRMIITVTWYPAYPSTEEGMPINVVFTGTKESAGIDSAESAEIIVYGAAETIIVNGYNGTVEIYTIDGKLVKSAKAADCAEISAEKGLYIVRTGKTAKKVAVK